MALASNALTSLASLEAYMSRGMPVRDMLTIYHDGSDSATAATVAVTAAGVLSLVITGGDNEGTTTKTLSAAANDTVAELVAVINALDKGFVAVAVGPGGADTGYLAPIPATSCFGVGATQYLQGRDTYAYEQAINAASSMMERWCNRTFASADYVQLYHGTDRGDFRVHEYPVTKLTRIAIGRQDAMRVRNTSTDAADATIRNDGTNLTCTVVGGANAGSDEIAISTDTVTTLAAAITALGGGWSAAASSSTTGAWLGSELLQHSAMGCLRDFAYLHVPDEAVADAQCELDTGIIHRGYAGGSLSPWGHHYPLAVTMPGILSEAPVWPRGRYNIYAEYTAGYSSIPIDLEMLCNELAATILRQGTHDSSLSSEGSAGYSYSSTGELWASEGFRKRLMAFRSLMPPQCRNV